MFILAYLEKNIISTCLITMKLKFYCFCKLHEHITILGRKTTGQCLATTFPFKDRSRCTDTLFFLPLLVLRGKSYRPGSLSRDFCIPGNSVIPLTQSPHQDSKSKVSDKLDPSKQLWVPLFKKQCNLLTMIK